MTPTTTAAPATDRPPTAQQDGNNKNQTAMPTLVEIKQQELQQEVCRIYREVKAADPGASWHKHTVQVAATTGLSPEGIKKILERNGITNPNKRNNDGSK